MIHAKDKIIQSINSYTKSCLKPSKVCSGVGVFALVDIKKDEDVFPDLFADDTLIEWNEIKNEVSKKYLSKLCNTNDRGVYLSRLPNEINISYYINHSVNPNVYHNLLKDKYLAIQDINAGDEILCEYTDQEKTNFN
ncbi:MAG: SET domain-containing protein [Minisyncoccia bacterium]